MCPHCNGEGLCQDDFHEDTFRAAGKELVESDEECPSGCGGTSYYPNACPRCNGAGSIDG